jgi:tetratricopeptide (TPR) repeat protein
LLVTSRREEPWLGLNTEALEVGGLGEDAVEELALAVLRNSIGATDLEWKLMDPPWQRDYDALLSELGGHPLALQIILPHMKDRPTAEVFRSLNEGAKWLDSRLADGASDRERTLAGCINYSFSALPQATRALLPVLGYFREWADAEQLALLSAAKGVPAPARGVTAEGWTEVLLQAQATGLVRREGVTSLFQLHPLLPWFLHLTVPEGGSAALEAMVRSYLITLASALVEVLRGRDGAAAVRGFATSRASLLHGLELSQRARAVGEVARLYDCLSEFMELGGQHGQLEFLRESLVKEWQPAPLLDPASEGGRFWLNLQFHRAHFYLRQRNLGAAEGIYREILAAAPGDEDVAATSYHNLGLVAHERHDLAEAEEWYAKALDVELHLGDENNAAKTYHQLGQVAHERHDLTRAEEWYAKSLEVKLRLSDEHGAAQTYGQLGIVAQDRHDLAEAEKWFGKALEVFLRLGDEYNAAKTYFNLGLVASLQGQPGCVNQFLQAFKLYIACNDQDSGCDVMDLLRLAYKAGIITRVVVEQAWQTEMGESLWTGIAEYIFGPDGQEGTSSTTDAPFA